MAKLKNKLKINYKNKLKKNKLKCFLIYGPEGENKILQ
jgi:hypothetical protein